MATVVTRASKGSALTWTEGDANITNLNTDKIENVVEDATPQLGGNLDVNGNSIVSASNGNITITPDGTGTIVLDGQNWPQAAPATNGQYLEGNSNGDIAWTDRVNAKTIYENVKNTSGGELTKGTPVYQSGISGNTITVGAARADDVAKLAVGILDETLADQAEGRMLVLGEIKGVNTSGFTSGDKVYLGETGGYTNTAPTGSSVAVQFLGVVNRIDSSNGSGFITGTLVEDSVKYTGTEFQFWSGSTWSTISGGISNVVDDTTPQLGGNLDVNGNSIVSASNGNIEITPDGTGKVRIDGIYYPTADGTANQVIQTDGAGNLSFGSISLALDDVSDVTLTAPSNGQVLNYNNGVWVNATPASGGISNVVEDTTPQLGGELDGQGNTVSNVNFKDYKETNYALTYAATITPDVANGNVQTVTLTGNVTFNAFANAETGQSMTLIVKQDATGSRTLTSSMKFAGADKTLSTAANSIDIISVFYDGTNYYASLAKGFA